ncbi:MAG: M20 metallopeptidase family protein [Lachnospiraceae bacterium]
MVSNEQLKQLLETEEPKVRQWHRWFHEHPELSLNEKHTSEKVREAVEELGLSWEQVGEYGLLVRMDGKGPGKTILLRADMDALPVSESEENLKGKKAFVSQNPGVSHACGHDAHIAMLLAAMEILWKLRSQWEGTVLFAFEQAEENGGGIFKMLDALKAYSIDTCYGTHVYAGLESGKLSVQPGERMAALTAFTIRVKGKGGHASRPDLTVNPLMCAANILVNLNSVWTGELDPTKTVTLGIGSMHSGEKGNVIADDAVFSGSMRYYDVEEGKKAFAALKRVCEGVAQAHRCQIEYDRILDSPYAVYNDPACAVLAQKGIKDLLGEDSVGYCEPWFATESMALYLDHYPGVFAFLGIRDPERGYGAGHHTREFDLDPAVLIKGVAACVKYTIDFLT